MNRTHCYGNTGLFSAIALLLLLLPFEGVSGNEDKCVLRMGWESWHPYQYLDESGELTGFDIDFISAIGKLIDCDVAFQEVNWARGMVDIENGNLDLIPNANFTEERSQWAHYSEPYRDNSTVMYIRKGELELYPFKSLSDIIGTEFRLGVGRGVVYGEKFLALTQDPDFQKHVQYIPTAEMQQYEMLQAGRIDGYLRSITAMKSLKDLLGSDINLQVHPVPVVSDRLHVVFSKKSVSAELVERFDEGLRTIQNNGLLERLVADYF